MPAKRQRLRVALVVVCLKREVLAADLVAALESLQLCYILNHVTNLVCSLSARLWCAFTSRCTRMHF